MRVFIPLIFLTLVVTSPWAHSAPTPRTTLDTQPLSPESDPYLSDKASPLRTPAPTWQMGVIGGFSGGNQLENDEWIQGPTFAIRFASLKLHHQPVWDFHFEVNKDNLVGVFAGRRWYCCEDQRFNPYLRLAAGTFLDASDQLGNLVELSRFRARAGAGLGDDLFFEMGFGYAVVGPDLYAILGYNFNF